MKNIYTAFSLLICCLVFGQYIPYNPDRDIFDSNENRYRSNKRPYEELRKRSEDAINRDMVNVRSIINNSGSIYGQIKEQQAKENGQEASSPGAPGEPVPIDKNIVQLFLVALVILVLLSGRIIGTGKKAA